MARKGGVGSVEGTRSQKTELFFFLFLSFFSPLFPNVSSHPVPKTDPNIRTVKHCDRVHSRLSNLSVELSVTKKETPDRFFSPHFFSPIL